MTEKAKRSFDLITKKMGFTPWGGCGECPYLSHCAGHEHELPTLPCELGDVSAGIKTAEEPRENRWDAKVGASVGG